MSHKLYLRNPTPTIFLQERAFSISLGSIRHQPTTPQSVLAYTGDTQPEPWWTYNDYEDAAGIDRSGNVVTESSLHQIDYGAPRWHPSRTVDGVVVKEMLWPEEWFVRGNDQSIDATCYYWVLRANVRMDGPLLFGTVETPFRFDDPDPRNTRGLYLIDPIEAPL